MCLVSLVGRSRTRQSVDRTAVTLHTGTATASLAGRNVRRAERVPAAGGRREGVAPRSEADNEHGNRRHRRRRNRLHLRDRRRARAAARLQTPREFSHSLHSLLTTYYLFLVSCCFLVSRWDSGDLHGHNHAGLYHSRIATLSKKLNNSSQNPSIT